MGKVLCGPFPINQFVYDLVQRNTYLLIDIAKFPKNFDYAKAFDYHAILKRKLNLAKMSYYINYPRQMITHESTAKYYSRVSYHLMSFYNYHTWIFPQ